MYSQYSFLGGFAKLCFHQLAIASLRAIVASRGAVKTKFLLVTDQYWVCPPIWCGPLP